MSVRNLGLLLDNTLGMEKQVNYIYKSCYYKIRNIGFIRKYINGETSREYRTVLTRTLNGEHTTPAALASCTFQLHWFPKTFRSLYVILLQSETCSLLTALWNKLPNHILNFQPVKKFVVRFLKLTLKKLTYI